MVESFYKVPADRALLVAIISDLHGRDGTEVLRSLKIHKPDLITIPGDFVLGKRPKENGKLIDVPLVAHQKNVLPFLSASAFIAPTYVSLGNHESFLDEEDLKLIRSTGVILLDNSFRKIQLTDEDYVIGGLNAGHVNNYRIYKEVWVREHGRTERYPSRAMREIPKWFVVEDEWLSEFEKQNGYKILLSHHPEYWCLREPHLAERKIDLVLSGHAHGGQVRLFEKGLYASGQGWLPKFTNGVFEGSHGTMVVSRGLANTAGVPRMFNELEIVYVEVCPMDDQHR